MAVIEGLRKDNRFINYRIQNIFRGFPVDGLFGWRSSAWYGNYWNDWPWIYHEEHGWQFIAEWLTEKEIHVWDFGLKEWLFFNEDTYRWMYIYGVNPGWIWAFQGNLPYKRFFKRADNGSIFRVQPGPLED